jgi:hypothetical protein
VQLKIGFFFVKEQTMERKKALLKTEGSRIFWTVLAVVLSAAPCVWAYTEVPVGEELDIDYPISGDLYVYGTVNLLPGAEILFGGVGAYGGSVVNIKGGYVEYEIVVFADAQVTVFGTDFSDTYSPYLSDQSDQTQWKPDPPFMETLSGIYENGQSFNLTFYDIDALVKDTYIILVDTAGGPGPEEIDIDIKPGSDPNPINPGSNGVIPVAILTTDTFDASTVDPGTVTLAGAEVAVRGKSEKTMARLEDVDGDGDDDLLLQVDTQSDDALWVSGAVVLTGETYDGQAIEGTDDVVIVPPA